jgi:hypothetical protein
MTTKEAIKAEIDKMSEEELAEFYPLFKRFVESIEVGNKPSFMEKLREIQIDAPGDLSTNLDLYLSGEKREQ